MRKLYFGLLLLLGLTACWQKPVPIDEDMNQRQQALQMAQDYFAAMAQGNQTQILEASLFPYWLDGHLADREEMQKEFAEAETELSHWRLLRARFYTRDDLEIFAPRFLRKLHESDLEPAYFVVLQFKDASRPQREAEGLIFLLDYQAGKWKIQGLED